MAYRSGELLYICDKNKNWENGLFVIYRDSYKGKEDLSYHGSPWYETFIVCEYCDSRDKVEFGNQTYCWRSANEYIKSMQSRLKEINKMAYV